MTMPITQAAHALHASNLHATVNGHSGTIDLTGDAGDLLARLRLLTSIDTLEGPDEVRVTDIAEDAPDQLTVHADSSIWETHQTSIRAVDDVLEIHTKVRGQGRITALRQLGAHSDDKGLLVSALMHRSVFAPTPDQPWRVFRRAEESAVLGVLGDGGETGMGRWLLTPPPLIFGLSPADEGDAAASGSWLMIGIAATARPFTQVAYRQGAQVMPLRTKRASALSASIRLA